MITTEEAIIEQRRPPVEYEEIEIESNEISKPSRELIVDTVALPQEAEIIETEIPAPVEV